MIKIKNKVLSFYRAIITSIAFYPTIIASVGFISIFIITVLKNYEITNIIEDFIPDAIVVKDIETARVVLSVIIGGLFSLTVFSFSMVMVVLNQAASNFSPRLLPGLISNKRHQIVLGVYLGTLIYCIFTLMSISPSEKEYQLDEFSILYAIILSIICLGLFVYFIHSISQEVQISHILRQIFRSTKTHLLELKEDANRQIKKAPNTDGWQELFNKETGYFQDFSDKTLAEIAEKHDTVFYIIPSKGMFVLENTPAIKSQKTLSEEVGQEALSCLQFSDTELIEDNYLLGFKQITEIAVKAMSPGINDPGTALNAIDYLTELFGLRMKIDDTQSYKSEEGTVRVHLHVVNFKDLIYSTFASLRQYCKHDVIIVRKLLQVLKYLHFQTTEDSEYHKIINEEIDTLLADANYSIQNETDLQVIKEFVKRLKKKYP
ncbi:MAG: DUF2254 domain-containing protein [Chitinophagales bacterium]